MNRVKLLVLFSIISISWTIYYTIVRDSKKLKEINVLSIYQFINDYPKRLNGCSIFQSSSTISYSYCSNNCTYLGKPFNKKLSKYVKHFKFHDYQWSDKEILRSTPVLVTAISDNHIKEALDHVTSWIKFSGSQKPIIIYDLGLTKENIEKLNSTFRNEIKIKSFQFNQYPESVGKLYEYRFKPTIIAQTLLDHPSVIWMDSSVVLKPNFTSVIRRIITSIRRPTRHMYPIVLLSYTGHSIYATTNPQMVAYLPIDEGRAKTTHMYQAAPLLIYPTSEVRFNVLKWWVLCALEDNCLAPVDHGRICKFGEESRHSFYANCHRYDQSAMNILLANVNKYNSTKYYVDAEDVMKFDRQAEPLNVLSFLKSVTKP